MKLEVVKVNFKYPGGPMVLKGASFYVRGGEAVAIVGPNGSGKTTLLLIASGLLEPDEGEVLLEGLLLKRMLPEARRKIGMVFQDPDDQLFNPTVYEELAFSLRQILPSEVEVRRRIEEVVEYFKLKEVLHRPPYKLSMGEKRKVALASALIYDPSILILDEPTVNLSLSSVMMVRKVITEAKSLGKAVVLSSHDSDFVVDVADRVYIMSNGALLGGEHTASILSNRALLELADIKPPSNLLKRP